MNINFIYWDVNPELISIMGFPLRYYGILFAGGILLCIAVLTRMFRKEGIAPGKLDTLTIYGVVGIFVGARLGHCLFYDPAYYLHHPWEMLLPIQQTADGGFHFAGYQGLASHGGGLGLIIALMVYSKRTGESILRTVDLIAVVAPLGGCFIRLGNLMNSEILGLPTQVPWAFIFVREDNQPRHPAQLYEAIAYLLIFALMLFLYRTRREKLNNGVSFGLVLTLIFLARFAIEYFKENQVGFEDQMAINMGQLLSLPYIFIGMGFVVYGLRKGGREKMEAEGNQRQSTEFSPMPNGDFNVSFLVDRSPDVVFSAVTNVRGWWSESLEGDSASLGDEFVYRHGDIHFSRHRLIELIPNEKVVWLTLDSKITFVEKQDEWNGTRVVFQLSKEGTQTRLDITHFGLVPDFQCFEGCSKGWTYYLKDSLVPLITTGKGNPDRKA
jgi:prolipoprotein diacylglyceryl transferase